MATKGATAKVTDWTLPGAACPGLVELLGIDTEQAAREAHRLEDAGVWRGLPPGVYLEDLPPEYRSAIETLMDAEAALRNVEDAVRTYRECYSPATLRRFPRHATDLRDYLNELIPMVSGTLAAVRQGPTRLIVNARRAGVDQRRLSLELEMLLDKTRETRDQAVARVSKKRQPDQPLRELVWGLGLTFERFALVKGPDWYRKRERFVKTVLKVAEIACPRDLPAWLPPKGKVPLSRKMPVSKT